MLRVKCNVTANTVAIGGVLITIGATLWTVEPFVGYRMLLLPLGIILVAIGICCVFGGCFDIVKSERIIEKWDDKLLRNTIKSAGQTSQIHIMQTWLPDKEDFCPFLEELLIEGGKQFRFKVLLMNYEDWQSSKSLLCSRVLLRSESAQDAAQHIEGTIKRFQQMKEHVDKAWEQIHMGAKLDLQIRLYDFMPLGPYYQVGDRACFVGLYLNTESSVHGPMLIVYNPQSRLWKKLHDNFEAGWNASRPLDQPVGALS